MSLAGNDQLPAPPRPPDVLLPDASQAPAAAANVGGTEAILAGRPGSWEAERVRQVLQSTVGGNDEYLWSHRTEPITITINVASILDHRGQYNPPYPRLHKARPDLARAARSRSGLPRLTGTSGRRCTRTSAHPRRPMLYAQSRTCSTTGLGAGSS
jgi:hypothetical protein